AQATTAQAPTAQATTGRSTTEDRLKALGAAAASAGGVALFHVVGITPEAASYAEVVRGPVQTHTVSVADLRAARERLSTVDGGELDAVSLGTPHFSVSEFAELAALLQRGPAFAESVQVYVSTSRAVLEAARAQGTAQTAEAAGATILT